MASVRGAYDSHLTCARFLRRQGGLIALAKREMASSGLTETEAPQCGDVGIISTSAGPMGAVRAGNLWALKAVDGLVLMPLPFLTAWSV